MAGVSNHNVYNEVQSQECYNETGGPPISTNWIDVNEGDGENPYFRSRWVGRQFKSSDRDRDDLVVATPPLGAKRSLIALASCQNGIPHNRRKKLGFIDTRKAYFHAKAKRLVYVTLPDEFCEPGEFGHVRGRLNYSLYGTTSLVECFRGLCTSSCRRLRTSMLRRRPGDVAIKMQTPTTSRFQF